MSKKLLGSGSSKKSRTSPKGIGGVSISDQSLSPAMRGTPEDVAAREYEATKGKSLHDQLKKNKSTGLKP